MKKGIWVAAAVALICVVAVWAEFSVKSTLACSAVDAGDENKAIGAFSFFLEGFIGETSFDEDQFFSTQNRIWEPVPTVARIVIFGNSVRGIDNFISTACVSSVADISQLIFVENGIEGSPLGIINKSDRFLSHKTSSWFFSGIAVPNNELQILSICPIGCTGSNPSAGASDHSAIERMIGCPSYVRQNEGSQSNAIHIFEGRNNIIKASFGFPKDVFGANSEIARLAGFFLFVFGGAFTVAAIRQKNLPSAILGGVLFVLGVYLSIPA